MMWCLLNKKLSEGDLDTAQLIINNNSTNLQLDRHLFYWVGDPERINFILKNNAANVNTTDESGNTPLFYAAEHRYISHGENTDELFFFRQTIPYSSKFYKVAELLIKAKALQKLLINAVKSGDKDIVSTLIDNSTKFNIRKDFGKTLMFIAIKKEQIDIIKLLLDRNADVDARDDGNHTGLFNAIHQNSKYIVKLLIRNNADVNAPYRNKTNNTLYRSGDLPLVEAINQNQKDIVELLIENGADVNAVDRAQMTPLLQAIEEEEKDVVELLIENGADVNVKDKYGSTALLNANHKDIVKLLINNGANVNAKDKRGNTFLIKTRDKEAAILALKCGADVNAINKYGRTPLSDAIESVAISGGDPELIQLLVDNGANPKYFDYEIFSEVYSHANYFELKIEKFLKENKFRKRL